jgi:hypothetical protein
MHVAGNDHVRNILYFVVIWETKFVMKLNTKMILQTVTIKSVKLSEHRKGSNTTVLFDSDGL